MFVPAELVVTKYCNGGGGYEVSVYKGGGLSQGPIVAVVLLPGCCQAEGWWS